MYLRLSEVKSCDLLNHLRHADCTVFLYTYREVNIFHIEIVIELLKHQSFEIIIHFKSESFQ